VYDKEFIGKLHAALYQNASKLALSPSPPPPKETTTTTSQKTSTQNNKASPLIDALSANNGSVDASNSKHDLEQIIAEFQPKKLCETITALQTEINETSIYKTSVEATRLLDISFEHIKQYRGM